MTRAQIETRMNTLRQELDTASGELSKLRPRVQYLETIMQRLDGALTVLQELLDAQTPAHAATAEDRDTHPSWHPVAPSGLPVRSGESAPGR